MRNALLISFGILLLAVVGFAGTEPGTPVLVSEDAVPNEPRVSEIQNAVTMGSMPTPPQAGGRELLQEPSTRLDAVLCKTALASRFSGDLDECEECQLDCMKEWQECRRTCGKPEDWGSCVEACTDDLEWCQTSGCAGACDSSSSQRVAKDRRRL